MRKNTFQGLLATILLILAMPASAGASAKDDQKQKPPMIQGCGYDPQGGANEYAGKGDNPHSRFYVNPDFYNLRTDSALTILTHFQTMQQTTEWSCGCVVVLLALNHLGMSSGQTECDLAEAMHSMTDSHVKGAKPGSATCFADPYDTSDHWQDGYTIASLERFFYSWKDRAIAPKPYQLQPFIVVERKY